MACNSALKPSFSVDEVVSRVLSASFPKGEFTLPDAYTDDEWSHIGKRAGVLGKRFNRYVLEHSELGIRYVENRKVKGRAVYKFIGA